MNFDYLEETPTPTDLPDADVIVYPLSFEGTLGVYGESSLTLVKELRQLGVTAEYLHDSEHRTWLGLNGTDLLITLCLNLVSSGAVAAVQIWITTKLGDKRIHIKAGRRKDPDGSVTEWFEATGSGAEIAKALDAWREEPVA